MSAICPKCTKTVFFAEAIETAGKSYHPSCHKCGKCGASLAKGEAADAQGADDIYCKKCYQANFGPKGFRGGHGAGYEGEADTSSLDADAKAKLDAKYNTENEAKARAFISSILPDVQIGEGPDGFAASLKNGSVLCHLLQKMGVSVPQPSTSGLAFKQMENISNFLAGCKTLGLRDSDCFMTVDLYEAKNMVAVVDCILMLKRVHEKHGK